MGRPKRANPSSPKKGKKAKIEEPPVEVDPTVQKQQELSAKLRSISEFGFGPELCVVNIHCGIIENTMDILIEKRSEQVNKSIELTNGLRVELQTAMDEKMVELIALRENAEQTLEQLEQEQNSIDELLEQKKQFTADEKALLSQKKDEVKDKKQEFNQSKKNLANQTQNLQVTNDEICDLESNTKFTGDWIAGSDRSNVEEQADKLLQVLEHFGGDSSLISTMTNLMKKDPETWGQFDMLSLNYAADFLSKKHTEWLAKKDESEAGIAVTEEETNKMEEACNQLVEEQTMLSTRVQNASQDQSQVNSQLTVKTKEIKDHKKAASQNPILIQELEEKLQSYKEFTNLFEELEKRTEIVPTPIPSPEPEQKPEEIEAPQEETSLEQIEFRPDQPEVSEQSEVTEQSDETEQAAEPVVEHQSPVKEHVSPMKDHEMANQNENELTHDELDETNKPTHHQQHQMVYEQHQYHQQQHYNYRYE